MVYTFICIAYVVLFPSRLLVPSPLPPSPPHLPYSSVHFLPSLEITVWKIPSLIENAVAVAISCHIAKFGPVEFDARDMEELPAG